MESGLPSIGRLGIGAMTGGMAFIASFLLALRDRSRFFRTKQKVSQQLMTRPIVDSSHFCGNLSLADDSLALDIRQAIGDYFKVPSAKIYADDMLADYHYQVFEPGFHYFVVMHVLKKRHRTIQSFVFPKQPIKSLKDFAREVQLVVAESQPAADRMKGSG
jgi:hypothetical protein